jgi:hypothetical protein
MTYNSFKKLELTARLPATAVTPATRQAMVSLAKKRGVSLGTLQREAIEIFLRKGHSDAIE